MSLHSAPRSLTLDQIVRVAANKNCSQLTTRVLETGTIRVVSLGLRGLWVVCFKRRARCVSVSADGQLHRCPRNAEQIALAFDVFIVAVRRLRIR
jgi:hypothetical protein